MTTEADIDRAINNITRRMFEQAKEKMVERGYEESDVRLVGNVIQFDTKKTPRVGLDPIWAFELPNKENDFMMGRTVDEYVDEWIDYYVDAPAYKYDEDFPIEGQYEPTTSGGTDPGTKVDIDELKDWIRETKTQQDPNLQEVATNSEKYEREVDRTAYRVARKIYYVGRKPSYMTPEDWDATTVYLRPAMNSFSQNESSTIHSFEYGSNYSYRQGVQ